MENNSISTEFSQFLQQEMALSRDDLAVVIKNRRQPGDPIPMLLWQYGLISLGELQRIWDWLDAQIQFQAP
ncbi:DUF2949 domain-containing protein [Crocosphaera watsonii WH 8501]|uniref:DUF2949 domain-containing protein n=5 Tax=Crocosphaera watsonii TaxID=263511 RepID=Q4C2Z4_CROWT|nr:MULTISPECIES: DUF2949 domain-containing protein [Crocosphaera]EAM50526.1 hypothetical protein CwatDRAFT_3844 [Crocosphaera watsonii WH 8501]MCH2243927.1 DUF2949 domain-containing protein [Crocosphaera sp.]NQZ62806.1 DUF2949 domain-containing protein [Crocosphaera sp.]CCQ49903.1 FIG00556796: hypothetical protein [Crocosphaera watsonii WH 8502]CCQ56631.1 hypothetical protein CWATWH0005_1649 [Crocosphaera watsonii WH 0005]